MQTSIVDCLYLLSASSSFTLTRLISSKCSLEAATNFEFLFSFFSISSYKSFVALF